MDILKNKHTFFSSTFLRNLLFWLCIFLYFMFSLNVANYEKGYPQLFFATSKTLIPQLVTAFVCLKILVPRYLNTKKPVLFAFWLLILLFAMFAFYLIILMYFYEPTYFLPTEINPSPFLERISNFSVFLSKAVKFIAPTALLLMARFYKNQQKLLQLNEQKKTAELTALKHQLNPHFLFNTLNNLYALAIKKSDQTPEVIEKLSDILDYMLYRCNDSYVSVQKEIELIENFLSLEKVRYGKRVKISLEKEIKQDVKIAPLLLLTFIENAFKHGVSQELKEAFITIKISLIEKQIVFIIENSIPKVSIEKEPEHCIGLKNVKKQLELLYPGNYFLEIEDQGPQSKASQNIFPSQDQNIGQTKPTRGNKKETYKVTLKLLAK